MLQRRTGDYFFRQRGWVDFLASIPLLVLNSGPAALGILAGGVTVAGMAGMVNVLKVVKAIRIARILRLLRVLKVFARIKNAESVMAQRHVAKISTTTVASIIFALLAASLLWSLVTLPSLDDTYREDIVEFLAFSRQIEDEQVLISAAAAQPGVLVLQRQDATLFSRYENSYYATHFGPGDYDVLDYDTLRLFVDLKPLNFAEARDNLVHFFVIVVVVLILLFGYSPHFALTVSDPIHVMRRGFEEPSYNLAVKISEAYGRDEVYRLAESYNEVYLPMKDRSSAGESAASQLSMDDIQDALE